MCGIYGFCGVQTKKTCKIIKNLGINNASRGRDSTGIALISKDRIELTKNILESSYFYMNPKVLQTISNFRRNSHTIAIGHTRLATHGAISQANAHPFQVANVLFAHNGIISNFEALQKEHNTNFEVDSQIIGYLIATMGMKKAFESLLGSFTVPFIMVDDPEVLHVATHNQDFAFATRGRQLYYSSDMMDLKDALKGQKGFTFCEGGNSLIYSFFDSGQKIEIVKEVFKPKKWIDSSYYSGYYNEYTDFESRSTSYSKTHAQQLSLLDSGVDMDCNDFECYMNHEHQFILNADNELIPNPKHQYYNASAYIDDKKVKKELDQIDDEYLREYGEYVDNYDTCNRLQCEIKHQHRFLFSKHSDNTWKLIRNPDFKEADDFKKVLEAEIN